MSTTRSRLPLVAGVLFLAFVCSLLARSYSDTTIALMVSSVLMFGCAWASAAHLLGARPAAKFVVLGLVIGWFAEEMGARYGWFFGGYDYTDVLGPRISEVPFVIPMMWFALCYTGYVISNLMIWRHPVDATPGWGNALLMSFLAAMIVTAFDLGGDPYLVYVLKAWIMHKKDGWWFGETIQGFFGWMTISFIIVLLFRRFAPPVIRASTPSDRRHTLLPLGIYAGTMVYQIFLGHPVETRTIACFAMGIPLIAAWIHWLHWAPGEAPAEATGDKA